MSILITGGAGFIGSHLTQWLLRETPDELVIIDDFNAYYDPRLKRANAALLRSEKRVTIVEGDYRDLELVRRIFGERGVQAVCHMGGSPGVPISVKKPLDTADNNFRGTLTLLEAAREYSVQRFLFASSSTVYGHGAAAPFVEDAPLGIPASPYGASKRAAELMGLTYHQLYGVPFVGLRFFNVYGPRLRPELALAAFTEKILAGEPLTLYGDGSVLRDFTHVSDICRGIAAALTAPGIAGECINLGSDRPISVRRLIELIESAAGRSANIQYLPPRAEDLPFTHASLEKARRLLQYEARVPLEQGVQEYVAWFRQTISAAPDA